MNTPPDPPAGLIPVPPKGSVLLLTQAEYLTGIRRGNWWRRPEAIQRREQGVPHRSSAGHSPENRRREADPMPPNTSSPEKSGRAAPGTPSGLVIGSPKCGQPMRERHASACSDRCRAAKRRRRRVPVPATEAKAIREGLTTILETAWEIKATLEKHGARSIREERNDCRGPSDTCRADNAGRSEP